MNQNNFEILHRESSGKDIGEFLSLARYLKDEEFSYVPKKKSGDPPNKLRILVIHDSYFYAMKPFFDLSFFQVDTFNFVQNETTEALQELLKHKPDIVLFITLERHIGNFDQRIYGIF